MLELASVLRDLASKNEAACLAIVVQSGRGPVRAGAKVVFDASGARRAGDAVFSDKLERELGQRAAEAVSAAEPALVDLADEACGATMKVYLEPQQRAHELVVLGRGPVAAALARIGAASGFRVRAVEQGFERMEAPGPSAHVVVATGHEADEAALGAALGGWPASVQLVASSRRAPIVLDALRKMRVPEEKLALVRSPAGLDLGGDSPEEIAVSIIAEILLLRRGGSGRPLSDVKGTRSATVPTTRLPIVSAPTPTLATAPPPAQAPPPKVPSLFSTAPRKPKVKFAMEDSDELKIATSHDEDFRPDDAPPAKPARVTKKTKRSNDDDDESFR